MALSREALWFLKQGTLRGQLRRLSGMQRQPRTAVGAFAIWAGDDCPWTREIPESTAKRWARMYTVQGTSSDGAVFRPTPAFLDSASGSGGSGGGGGGGGGGGYTFVLPGEALPLLLDGFLARVARQAEFDWAGDGAGRRAAMDAGGGFWDEFWQEKLGQAWVTGLRDRLMCAVQTRADAVRRASEIKRRKSTMVEFSTTTNTRARVSQSPFTVVCMVLRWRLGSRPNTPTPHPRAMPQATYETPHCPPPE
jgi:hypothetical protein